MTKCYDSVVIQNCGKGEILVLENLILSRSSFVRLVGDAVVCPLGLEILKENGVSTRGLSDRAIRKGIEKAITWRRVDNAQWSWKVAGALEAMTNCLGLDGNPELISIGRSRLLAHIEQRLQRLDLIDPTPFRRFFLAGRQFYVLLLCDFSVSQEIVEKFEQEGENQELYLDFEAIRRAREGKVEDIVPISELSVPLLASWLSYPLKLTLS